MHRSVLHTTHCARTRVAYQIKSVNWRGGHQNCDACIRVHDSISADRPLFPVFKLALLLSGNQPHGERLILKVRISVSAAFNTPVKILNNLLI
ncbi:hypothetical protein Y032_0015g2634 [Ancylostoma ceylanicum]|uniref:Uncharacterized protein n=1 Tax=Ancylostoma ceylanicum TaxID=53326 RepID=A0A016V9J3_9BILA|nr:hypothetical protein Y032_0015g2634 [Ancylostoma ceylanicum]